jgi:ankyrin repeat protein
MPIPDRDYTGLHRAAEFCDIEKARTELGELPNTDKKEKINLVDREGRTPLAYAAQKGCLEIVKLLIEAGAGVDTTDDNSRWTPLHYAAENQHTEVVAHLLKYGANVNAKAGYLGQTPLTEAILGPYFGEDSESDRRETVRLLLEAGADVNLPGRTGWTPAITAVFREDVEIMQSLIRKGANILTKDEKGKSALEYAAEDNKSGLWDFLYS